MKKDAGLVDARQLVVVEDDDPTSTNQATEVIEVEEHPVEPMVAVDEREIEYASFSEEAGKGDLRFQLVMHDERRDSGFFEVPETATGEASPVGPVRLVRVDSDVERIGMPIGHQRFADEERRDAVGEPYLDRRVCVFAADPRPERLAQRRRNGDGKYLLARAVLADNARTISHQTIDDLSHQEHARLCDPHTACRKPGSRCYAWQEGASDGSG